MKNISKITRTILSCILCLTVVLSHVQPMSLIALAEEVTEEAVTANVTTEAELTTALNNTDVDIIHLQNEITISRSEDGKDNAFVIPRPVIITGEGTGGGTSGGLRLERAGVILGGAVTLEHMSIYFANPVRNAIIANGYDLTINNISNGGSSYNIDIFGGGITDYNGGNAAEIPPAGTGADIVIKGTNTFTGANASVAGGNIYAGSLSDVGSGTADTPNKYSGNVNITIEKNASGIGAVYAHGARENREGGYPNAWNASADLYKVTSDVVISLYKCMSVTVDGATGGTENATFIYKDDGKGYLCSPTLKNISGISLLPADNAARAYCAPNIAGKCSLEKMSVPANTRLSFANMDAATISVSEFIGGGEIIFSGEVSQMLSVTEKISGMTKVAVGGIDVYGSSSTGNVAAGQTYIAVTGADAESYGFELLPDYNNETMVLENDGKGNWVTEPGESTIVIKTIGEIADIEVAENENGEMPFEILIPMNVVYATETEYNFLGDIPMLVTVNGEETFAEVGIMGYQYTTGVTSDDLFMEFSYGDEGEIFYIANAEGYDFSIPMGKYEISITIPGRYMESGEDKTLSFAVSVASAVTEPSCNHTGATEVKDAKEATCGAEGYTGDTYCILCGVKTENGKAIAKKPHTYGEPAFRWSADGKNCSVIFTCKNNASHTSVQSAAVTSKVKTVATCKSKGTTTYTATYTDAGKTYTNSKDVTDIPVNAKNHVGGSEVKNTKKATCQADGYTGDTYCKGCGAKTASGKTVLKLAHTWDKGVVTKKATATKKGEKTYTCKMCKATKIKKIPALGAPKKGTKEKIGKATYKVTKSDLKNGTVSYVAPTSKKATTVTIPATVKIDGVTFKVTSIEKNAFKNNKKVKQVTIGKNVTTIGKQAFYGCSKLKTLTIKSSKLTAKKIGSKAFGKTPKSMKVTVPKKKFKTYKSMLIDKGVNKKATFKKVS